MKSIGLVAAMILISLPIFAQTWVEADDEGYVKSEYTVLTEAQFNRLLRQYEASKAYGSFDFEDVLKKKPSDFKVISGRKPVFKGYYYLLNKVTVDESTLSAEEKMFVGFIKGESLIYGHTNTGELRISFPDMMTAGLQMAFSPNSIADITTEDYKQKRAQFFGFVKEE